MNQLVLKDLFTQKIFGYVFPLFILFPFYMSNLARSAA